MLFLLFITIVSAGNIHGILYEVWHTRAAQAAHTLDDVFGPYNVSSDIYNVQP